MSRILFKISNFLTTIINFLKLENSLTLLGLPQFTPIFSKIERKIWKLFAPKVLIRAQRSEFTVPYDANQNFSRYWLFLTVRNQRIPHYEKEPILSKLIYIQGVEIGLKATICTRSKIFKTRHVRKNLKFSKNLKGVSSDI